MKKKLVVGMLILTFVLSACVSATSDEAEDTETLKLKEVDDEDVSSSVTLEWTGKEMEDFWDNVKTGGGAFDDLTDGYDSGIEIEISPLS